MVKFVKKKQKFLNQVGKYLEMLYFIDFVSKYIF